MSEGDYPRPVAEIVATLLDIFRHQRQSEIAELLESVNASFDSIGYDNWNGGTTTWALRLQAPVPVFASIEPRLAAIEKEILAKLGYLNRVHTNDPVEEVSVAPITPGSALIGQRLAPSEIEVRRLWPDGRFRLFLSHVSKHKAEVSKLKAQLALHGVAAFVAHEDIEPSLAWREETELGLKSMHALAALITPDFHASPWTDQEVGWALGRGVLVVPVLLGANPYGFAGRTQGISGSLERPKALAISIVNTLVSNPQTHGEMRRGIASAFCTARSYEMAQALRKAIETITDFTNEEKAELEKACTDNSNIRDAYSVPEAVLRVIGKPLVAEAAPTPSPPEDDDVPF